MKLYRFYWKYAQSHLFRFLLAMLITIPLGMMDGMIPWAIKPFFDGLTKGKGANVHLELIPLMILGFSVVQGVLGYFSRYLEGWVGQKMVTDLRMDAYKKLLRHDLQCLYKNDSGYTLVRIFNDPVRIRSFILVSLRTIMTRLSSIASVSFAMFAMNAQLAAISLGAVIILIVPMMAVRKKTFSQSNAETEGNSEIMTLLNSTVTGFKVILSFNLHTEVSRRFVEGHERIFSKILGMYKTQAWLTPCAYIITALSIAAIMYYGGHLIENHAMTPGALVAFITSLLMLYRPIRSFGDTIVNAQREFTSLTRFKQMMEDTATNQADTGHLAKMRRLRREIEIKNLSFRYELRESAVVLNQVNLMIPRGKRVALVGRSGSGKTTLAELLMGLYPLKNPDSDILFDGVSIREMDLMSIRQQISYVNQDTFLFDGTLRENVLMGRFTATEEELVLALKQANLHVFVESLPKGLDTEIGERGVLLSGGQRQRLAIARAFLKNAPILILDEATSSLDNESEAAVQAALEELMVNRTTLVIAHRLSTVQDADKIVVLDGGRILEEGTHSELLARGQVYYQLFHAQKFTPTAPPEAETAAITPTNVLHPLPSPL